MLKIARNPDLEIWKTVREAVQSNSGYCPCKIEKTPDTKCPCKEFRQQDYEGECHCGLYIKVNDKDVIKENEE